MLEQDGWSVVGEAHDGSTAIDAVASLSPDVVLLDIGLPDIDGFAVAERLAAVDAARPDVVLVSSRDREAYGDRVAASHARGFVAKGDLDGPTLRAMVDGSQRR
jgi:DNA-binding NarL/FixJ family response regulator